MEEKNPLNDDNDYGDTIASATMPDDNITRKDLDIIEGADEIAGNFGDASSRLFSDESGEDEEDWSYLKRLVNSREFQWGILFTVLLGAVVTGVQTDRELRGNTALKVIDGLILTVFIVEAILRMGAEWPTPQKYFEDGWNVFDFSIVILGIVEEIVNAATSDSLGGGANFVVVLRLARLFRLFKMLRSVRQLQLLATTMLKSMPSVGYMMIPVLLVFYIFGVLGCYLFQNHDGRFFGNLGRSLTTLIQVVTLDDWTLVLYTEWFGCAKYYRPIDKEVYGCDETYKGHGGAVSLYFIMFILIGTFCVINLFIGIVVGKFGESMDEVKELNEELDKSDGPPKEHSTEAQQHQQIKQILKSIERKVDMNKRRTNILKQSLDHRSQRS